MAAHITCNCSSLSNICDVCSVIKMNVAHSFEEMYPPNLQTFELLEVIMEHNDAILCDFESAVPLLVSQADPEPQPEPQVQLESQPELQLALKTKNAADYKCPECPKTFQQKFKLFRHLPTHTNERKHCCEHCGQAFRRFSTLWQHRVLHSKERPYKCDACGKTFNRISTLNSHRKTHTHPKEHLCDVCGKAFHQKGNLRHHIYTHTNERPYKCPACEKGFNQQSNLRTHFCNMHPNEAFVIGTKRSSAKPALRVQYPSYKVDGGKENADVTMDDFTGGSLTFAGNPPPSHEHALGNRQVSYDLVIPMEVFDVDAADKESADYFVGNTEFHAMAPLRADMQIDDGMRMPDGAFLDAMNTLKSQRLTVHNQDITDDLSLQPERP